MSEVKADRLRVMAKRGGATTAAIPGHLARVGRTGRETQQKRATSKSPKPQHELDRAARDTRVTVAFTVIVAALLFVGGVVVLGFGAWMWARAGAELVRFGSHRQQAVTDAALARESFDAVAETKPQRHWKAPTDDDVRIAQLLERGMKGASNGQAPDAGDIVDTLRGDDGNQVRSGFEGGLYSDV